MTGLGDDDGRDGPDQDQALLAYLLWREVQSGRMSATDPIWAGCAYFVLVGVVIGIGLLVLLALTALASVM